MSFYRNTNLKIITEWLTSCIVHDNDMFEGLKDRLLKTTKEVYLRDLR